jgi:hypothetical protein
VASSFCYAILSIPKDLGYAFAPLLTLAPLMWRTITQHHFLAKGFHQLLVEVFLLALPNGIGDFDK